MSRIVCTRWSALATAVIVTAGCRSKSDGDAAASSAAASAVPVDRLAPGELKPGTETIYGLRLPEGMKIIARFDDSIHAGGKLSPEDVAKYVKDRVTVSRVELEAIGTVFPNARITSGDPNRLYRIEVSGDAKEPRTTLRVEDLTRPKAVQGIDDSERLRRVGLTPNGRLLDPSKLE